MGRFYLPPQVIVVVAVLAAVGAVLLVLARPASGHEAAKPPAQQPVERPAPESASVSVSVDDPVPEPEPVPAPAAVRREPGFLIVEPAPGRRVVVRSRPGGRVVARLGGRTEFGSRTTLAVAARRGRWLGVVTTYVPNGRLGWVDPEESRLVSRRTRVSVRIDLSARRLVVRRGERVLRRITVAVGRPGSPTPRGRFAVTDKIAGARYSASYGCCILALSAHQPRLPAGWQGGDRIAVHGTNDPASIGTAVSAGCPRASDRDMRYLFRTVPLGAPVFVRG